MASQKDLEELAEQIRQGIAKRGVHVLDGEELAPVGDFQGSGPTLEDRLHLDNFARLYGFDVHYSTFLHVAIFRQQDGDDASDAMKAKI